MKRAVLDTNILTAGLRSRQGASFAVLSLLADGFLKARAGTATGAGLRSFLDRVPDRPPHTGDELER